MTLPIYIDFSGNTSEFELSELKETMSDIEKIIEKYPYSNKMEATPTGIIITPLRNKDTQELRIIKDREYLIQYIDNIIDRHTEKDILDENLFHVIPMKYHNLESYRVIAKYDALEKK
ncbi:MAG: hypothetical protein ACP5N1_06415 [Candidatus Woesearchaeota archaeon]